MNGREGRVVGLFTAPEAGAPVQRHDAVDVVAGAGIPGDRYATSLGHWSDPRWPDQELTLVESELADALGVEAGSLRRNIVTAGIDLASLIGREFAIGSAVLRGVRACDPCRYIETLTRPGLFTELAGRGGLRAAVLQSGTIRTGDALVLREPAGVRQSPAPGVSGIERPG